jgi:hypothetical protein
MNVKLESSCDLEEDPCVPNQYKPTRNKKSRSFQA